MLKTLECPPTMAKVFISTTILFCVMIFRNPICLFLLAVFLTACQNDLVGSGPITLSPNVKQTYEEFKKRSDPGYFAVTPDGRVFGYSYCPAAQCREGAMLLALDYCEKYAKRTCKIYADGMRVLWRGANDSSNLSSIDPETLCRLAGVYRTGYDPVWDKDEGSKQYVKEAKRRGLSIGDCAYATGFSARTTQPKKSLATLTAAQLCRLALDDGEGNRNWGGKKEHIKPLAEVRHRGYSIEDCRKSIGLN